MKKTLIALSAFAILAMTGCASGVKLDEPAPVEDMTSNQGARTGAGSWGSANGTGSDGVRSVSVDNANSVAAAEAANTLYFEFDSFALRPEYQSSLEQHAKVMRANGTWQMVIEGHADERGGREYNLALGQKRAEVVAQNLQILGVNAARIEPVSFGKEKPAVAGIDEETHAKNRRAVIRFDKR